MFFPCVAPGPSPTVVSIRKAWRRSCMDVSEERTYHPSLSHFKCSLILFEGMEEAQLETAIDGAGEELFSDDLPATHQQTATCRE